VLTNRSIIVAERSTIEIEASDPEYPVFLTLDGRKPIHVERGSIVRIRKAKKMLPLASLPDDSFFSWVRQKLKWTGSNVLNRRPVLLGGKFAIESSAKTV